MALSLEEIEATFVPSGPLSRERGEEVVRRGKAIYEAQIKPLVEPERNNEYIVIDIETGDYEVGKDPVAVSHAMRRKYGADRLYGERVGWGCGGKMGWHATSRRTQ